MGPVTRFKNDFERQSGIGLMEAVVAVLATLIIGSIVYQFVRTAISNYKLNKATTGVVETLQQAHELAKAKDDKVKVIFSAQTSRYGIDRNNNGRLDYPEATELPSGIDIGEDAVVIFSRTGKLTKDSKPPEINISDERNSHTVSVSSLGYVELD